MGGGGAMMFFRMPLLFYINVTRLVGNSGN